MSYSQLFLVLLLSTLSVLVQSALTNEFDYCGIDGRKYLDYNFTGDHNVAGEGCTLGNKTNCLCSIDYNDNSSLSPFIWQCGGTVKFGPNGNKTCPPKVPVVKPTGVNSIDFTESMLGVPVVCDTADYPTGFPGDEACGYSECESGGDYTAICACVDFAKRGVNFTGMQWICLHSTCNCPSDGQNTTKTDNSTKADNSSSGAASATPLLFLVGASLALVGAAF
jgi:hypothetical protein